MASLFKTFIKQPGLITLMREKSSVPFVIAGANEAKTETVEIVGSRVRESALSGAMKLIDVNSVARDLDAQIDEGSFRRIIPSIPITPPFKSCWLEWACDPGRVAVAVTRMNDSIEMAVFFERAVACVSGIACEGPDVVAWVNDSDPPADDFLVETAIDNYDEGYAYYCIAVALHALARMNCRNVTIEPRSQDVRPKPNKKLVAINRGIVWHEIVIGDTPKRNAKEIEDEGGRAVRSHWVRGHYADYRKGNGLFGRLKGVFWMPEHKRGSEEVGEVISTYKVA